MKLCSFVALVLCIFIFAKTEAKKDHPLQYCVHVDQFDLNPYREIKDGKELAYLENLFISLISTESDEPGILSGYEFSPDGKVFRSRVNKSIVWSNGEPVDPKEVVFSLLKGFKYRAIGQKIKIKGLNKDLKTLEDLNAVSGLKWKENDIFEIYFDSDISNITGVVREAFSSGSNQNRIWIEKKAKIKNNTFKTDSVYLSRNPIYSISPTQIDTVALGSPVSLVSNPKCAGSEMGIYAPALKADLKLYDDIPSPMKSSVSAVFNTTLSKEKRIALAELLNLGFTHPDVPLQFTKVSSFYAEGDPGFSLDQPWKNIKAARSAEFKFFKIFCEVPIYKDILIRVCPNCEYIPTGDSRVQTADVQLFSSTISGGRHIIFQDFLEWDLMPEFLVKAPKTKEVLKRISKMSASTVPPDDKILKEFEIIAYNEMSVMPISNRILRAYTKKGIPIMLDFNGKGELVFRKNKFGSATPAVNLDTK